MAKVRLFDYLKENMCIVKTLIKAGQLQSEVLFHFQIYNFYESTLSLKSKMDRYQFTAEQYKVSSNHVRQIVYKMEQTI